MPVYWSQTFLHLIILILFRRKGHVVVPENSAFAEVYVSQQVTVYTVRTSNFNSYFLGCIIVLTTKYHFWLSKPVSLQKMMLLEDLLANWTIKVFYTIEKKPFFLQDASDITIEKCLLLHCSNIGIWQTHFTLSIFLTSHLLWQGLLIKVNLPTDLILPCIMVPCPALYVYF